jgi:hypothetical protein
MMDSQAFNSSKMYASQPNSQKPNQSYKVKQAVASGGQQANGQPVTATAQGVDINLAADMINLQQVDLSQILKQMSKQQIEQLLSDPEVAKILKTNSKSPQN